MQEKLASIEKVADYLSEATTDSFSFAHWTSLFQLSPGLRRSVDKMYEITVYALFSTIVRELKARVTLQLENEDTEISKDFESFIKTVSA